MAEEYRLEYTDLSSPDPQYLKAYPISYGSAAKSPKQQRYFYAVWEKEGRRRRVCFVKLQNLHEGRARIEQRSSQSSHINSPYITAQLDEAVMRAQAVQWKNKDGPEGGEQWELLPGQILLFEYMPCDLEQFWKKRAGTASGDRLSDDRGQILLKLLEGIGHLHRSKLTHCDIKPKNIMINCAEQCEDAPWFLDELDVKLTDFDSVHDGYKADPTFLTGTPPFQPRWHYQVDEWLDLYSVCMVALWLYGRGEPEDYSFLERLSEKPCQSEDEIYAIIQSGRVQFPKKFLAYIVPVILQSTQVLSSVPSRADFHRVLAELADHLQDFYFGEGARALAGLLMPSKRQTAWRAVIQIDQDYWPVFGCGREYRLLPLIGRSGQQTEGWDSSPVSVSLGTEHIPGESTFGKNILIGMPEICVTCEEQNGVRKIPSLKVSVFGSAKRRDEDVYQPQCLLEQRNILQGADKVLFRGDDHLYIGPKAASLFQSIRVCSVDFSRGAPPDPLPPFTGPRGGEPAGINIVLAMGVSRKHSVQEPSYRLLQEVAGQITGLEGCRCYGVTMHTLEPEPRSFCNGKQNVRPEVLTQSFLSTTNGKYTFGEFSWKTGSGGGHLFDPRWPTVAICYLDSCEAGMRMAQLRQDLRKMSDEFQYAVDFLQLFLPSRPEDCEVKRWEQDWMPVLPHCAAIVRPDGAFIASVLKDDPEAVPGHWLTVIHSYYQRIWTGKAGG